MRLTDLHTHTVYCDGKNTPEQMVLKGIERGLKCIGVLAHSYCEFEPDAFLHPDKIKEFQNTVNELKVKYQDNIKVLCGVEQDAFSNKAITTKGFDYVIGSVHYFNVDGKFYPIDLSEESFVKNVNELFNGDYYSAVENYFSTVGQVIELTGADIIGHFDLIKKFNQNEKYFSTSHDRYVCAYRKAVDKLVAYKKPFEINVGQMAKGNANEPYPSKKIREYISSKGGFFVYGSDSHSEQTVGYEIENWTDFITENF